MPEPESRFATRAYTDPQPPASTRDDRGPAAPPPAQTLAYESGPRPSRAHAAEPHTDARAGLDATLAAPEETLAAPANPATLSLTSTGSDANARPSRAGSKGPPTLVARTSIVLPRQPADADRDDALALPPDVPHPRYVAHDILGEGGMGEVVLARDHDIHRRVAIKRLRGDSAGPVALLRFAEEIRTVGALEHPGIVPVYDVGVDHTGAHFFVMKYLEGETLESVLEKLSKGDPTYTARYTPELRAHMFLQILRAVDYAHARGIIHRDLKPANIMVGPFGEVTVTDWGIAKRIRAEGEPRPQYPGPRGTLATGKKRKLFDLRSIKRLRRERAQLARGEQYAGKAQSIEEPARPSMRATGRAIETRVGALMGTPMYMSPEQARGENDKLDERSDVYALGVLFYELMTLEHYLGDTNNVAEVVDALVHKPMSPRIAAGWSRARAPNLFLHFTLAAMEHDPNARFGSAGAMADELEQILSGNVCIQCPYTFAERVTREFRRFTDRHPRLGVLVMLVVPMMLLAALPLAAWGLLHGAR